MKLETVDYNKLMWVSVAKENEVGDVVSLLHFLAKEEGFYDYIPSNISDVVSKLIKDETVLCLRTEDGTIVGLFIYTIFLSPHLIFRKSLSQELVWCVKKEHRKYSFMLLEHYENASKEKGCTHAVLAVNEEHKRNKALKRFYKHNGYNVLETMYEKDLIKCH